MTKNNKFLRQCSFCRQHKSKEELIRITKNHLTNEISLNKDSKINGRSIYVCKNTKCIEGTLKKKKIENSLKSKVTEKLKIELYKIVDEANI